MYLDAVINTHNLIIVLSPTLLFFFFNDTATTEIYTLSLHDALPIFRDFLGIRIIHFDPAKGSGLPAEFVPKLQLLADKDRKSTRLNSSHPSISYAVFCLKKKKKHNIITL